MEENYLKKDLQLDLSKKPNNLSEYEIWLEMKKILVPMEPPKRDSSGILINYLNELKTFDHFYSVEKHPNVYVGRKDNGDIISMRFISKISELEERINKLIEGPLNKIKENIKV